MNVRELLQTGHLTEAVEGAIADVKQNPTDAARRFLLAELFCFQGEFERADKQLDTLMQQSSEGMVRVSQFRQILRGEIARQQFYQEGRLPEFVTEPSPALRLHLDASIAIREGQLKEAAELLEQAESLRPLVAGSLNGKPFDDFRDLDDLNSGFFEVLTSTGKYYWVPTETVTSLEFEKPERSIDLVWRTAQISVTNGPEGTVFIPTIYVGTLSQADLPLKLGRRTDWVGGEQSPVRGLGQRSFLAGDDAVDILQIEQIEFETAGAEATDASAAE